MTRRTRYLNLFGYRIAALAEAETVGYIQSAIDHRTPLRALQINVGNLYATRRDRWLADVYRRAELLSVDGAGIYLGARLTGIRLPGRQTGVGIMFRLLADGGRRGDRFYLLGATNDVLAEAVAEVERSFGPVVAGSHHGYFRTEAEQREIVRDIRASRAGIVLVGMSSPRKEAWIDRWTSALHIPQLGVGGSFDVLAGQHRLAPAWMRRAGLEWSYRLLQEPQRLWRRYLFSNLWYAGFLLCEVFNARLRGRR